MVGDLRDEADEIYSPHLNSTADITVSLRTVPTMADQVQHTRITPARKTYEIHES